MKNIAIFDDGIVRGVMKISPEQIHSLNKRERSLAEYILKLEERLRQLEESFAEYVLLGGTDYALPTKSERAEEVKEVDEATFWDLEHRD